MADDDVIVSSAVVVPETATKEVVSPTSTHKRRASSVSSSDSKRPRLDSIDQSDSTTTQTLSKRGRLDADERKRGKRLFGGLLGALSQNSSSTAQKRRIDIERKQRDKLKVQAQEDNQAKQNQIEKLKALRREEQKVWERQARRTQQEHEELLTRFLRTKAKPVLYYKPWELLRDEEEIIKQQIKEFADTQFQADLHNDGNGPAERGDVEMTDDTPYPDKDTKAPGKDDPLPRNGHKGGQSITEDTTAVAEPNLEAITEVAKYTSVSTIADGSEPPASEVKDSMEVEDAIHHGEEDAVLY